MFIFFNLTFSSYLLKLYLLNTLWHFVFIHVLIFFVLQVISFSLSIAYVCCLCVCVFSVWISWALSSMLEFSSNINQAKGIMFPWQFYHWWVTVRLILCISVFYAVVFVLKEIRFYSGIQFPHYLLQFSEKSLSLSFFREQLCVCVCVCVCVCEVTGRKLHDTLNTAMG